MKIWNAVAAALLAAPGPAAAMTDIEAITHAGALGSILAAEDPCRLTFDQEAISAYVKRTVPADRIDYASLLQTQILGQTSLLAGTTDSALAAQCAAAEQSARHLGLIAP